MDQKKSLMPLTYFSNRSIISPIGISLRISLHAAINMVIGASSTRLSIARKEKNE